MKTEPNFKIDYGVSKKGNKTIIVSQVPTEKYPYERKQAFNCSQKYSEIVKIKTLKDRDFFEKYLNKTVEDVLKIAFNNQDWRLLPFDPITNSVVIESKMPDWVYYSPNNNQGC